MRLERPAREPFGELLALACGRIVRAGRHRRVVGSRARKDSAAKLPYCFGRPEVVARGRSATLRGRRPVTALTVRVHERLAEPLIGERRPTGRTGTVLERRLLACGRR